MVFKHPYDIKIMVSIEFSRKKLVLLLGLLFGLGIFLSVSNAFCAVALGRLFAPFLYGITIVAFAAGVATALVFQWKIDRVQLSKAFSILPEDEKNVLMIITEKKHITQTDLRLMSGLSKVKVSRIIDRLEKRKIVEKKPYGNTNLIISNI